MNEEEKRRLRDLFADAQEIPEKDRAAFLDRELAGEPEMRARIERLLAAGAAAGEFLESRDPARDHGAVGPYRLLEVLGEGGFGVVYLAEQLRPIRRRVALKLIKPGMDTKQVIARFETERQTLALMDHPGIAQVFEAGETETGRPYFAMEHVRGVPITVYCDEERLSIRERLWILLLACDAVQHAHQKGVIHRDLKPSNVLVARRDGEPSLKVIDFGIVKATTDPSTGTTLMTGEGMIVGTLGYMSPEQAGASTAVDTRSDIYSLGVMLYELLTGSPPFDPERLRHAALSDAVRIVREEDPPTLAARVASTGERIAELADRRSTDERRLRRELKSELQWITMRTLEKDPERRYASAAELAADIRRYLANEPVLAGAPSTMYRLRKLARRHRAGVAAAAVMLLALVTGGIATGVGFRRAVQAEHVAQREAASSRRVADFLVGLFRASSPGQSRGQNVSARDLLDQGTRRIRGSLAEDPQVRARLLGALGEAHVTLGFYEDGLALSREALAASESARPRDPLEVAERLRSLAACLRMAGKPEEVGALLDRAIAAAQTSDDASPRFEAECLWMKGTWLTDRGDPRTGDSLLTLAIANCETEAIPDENLLMRAHNSKGIASYYLGQGDAAKRHTLRALELSETNGAEPTWTVTIRKGLATFYSAEFNSEEAMRHAEEGVRTARQIFPPDHPQLADMLGTQAIALESGGNYEQAAVVREESIRILRAAGNPHLLANRLQESATNYQRMGRLDLAIERSREAWKIYDDTFGSESVKTADKLSDLARRYWEADRLRSADSTYRAAIPVLDRLDKTGFAAAYAYMGHANVCRDLGEAERADTLYRHAAATLDSSEANEKPYLGECLLDHAYLRSLEGRHAEADSMADRAFAMLSGDICWGYVQWAAIRVRAGDADGAVTKLREAAGCGSTVKDAEKYPELGPLRSRSDFPLGPSS